MGYQQEQNKCRFIFVLGIIAFGLSMPHCIFASQLFDYVKKDFRANIPTDLAQIKCEAGDEACDHLKYKLAVTYNLLYPVDTVQPDFFEVFEAPPEACSKIKTNLSYNNKAHWTCTFFGLREAIKYQLLNLSTAKCAGGATIGQIADFWETAAKSCEAKRIDGFFDCLAKQSGKAPTEEVVNSLLELQRLGKQLVLFQDTCRSERQSGVFADKQADYCRYHEYLAFTEHLRNFEWLRSNADLISTWQPGFEPQHVPDYFFLLNSCEKKKKTHSHIPFPKVTEPCLSEQLASDQKLVHAAELGINAAEMANPVRQAIDETFDKKLKDKKLKPKQKKTIEKLSKEEKSAPEVNLDDASTHGSGAAAEAEKKKDAEPKVEDTKQADKKDAKKQVAVKEEKEKLIEDLRKQFEIKVDLPKKDPPQSPPPTRQVDGTSKEQQALNQVFANTVKDAAKELKNGQYVLPPEMAQMGKLLLQSEVEDLKITAGKKAEERKRISADWDSTVARYKNLYKSTKGSFEERLSQLMLKVNEEFTRRYVKREEYPNAIFMSECMNKQFCNCVGNTKVSTSLALAVLAGESIPENKKILMQDKGYHLAAVVYDTKEKTAWDLLAGGSPTKELLGNYYHPVELMNMELRRKGAVATDSKELLFVAGRVQMTEKEKQLLAAGGSLNKKGLSQFSDGTQGNVELEDFMHSENSKTEHQYGTPYNALIQGHEASGYELPIVHWNEARRALRKLLDSDEFKKIIELRKQPLLLATENYTWQKMQMLLATQNAIYSALSGHSYVTGQNEEMGRTQLRKALGRENPELAALYDIANSERASLSMAQNNQNQEMKKYLDLFTVLGPDRWGYYKELISASAYENYLSMALERPPLMLMDLNMVDIYFSNEEKVSYSTKYRRSSNGSENLKEPPSIDLQSSAESIKHDAVEKTSQSRGAAASRKNDAPIEPLRSQGFGDDDKGIAFKKEKAGAYQFTPRQYAEFIQQSYLYGNSKLNQKWTPALTAALRDQGEYSKSLVDYFTFTGYRGIPDSRPEDSLVISGPDKKPIPKDVAALLVDFLQEKDGTGARKKELLERIKENYGSVAKYIKQVKADFAKQKKPPTNSEPDLDMTDVFKKSSKQRSLT